MGSSLFSFFFKVFEKNLGYVGIRKQFLDFLFFLFLRTTVMNLKNHSDIKT